MTFLLIIAILVVSVPCVAILIFTFLPSKTLSDIEDKLKKGDADSSNNLTS